MSRPSGVKWETSSIFAAKVNRFGSPALLRLPHRVVEGPGAGRNKRDPFPSGEKPETNVKTQASGEVTIG